MENEPFVFPPDDSIIELEVHTLPGHKRDVEALFVVAMDADYKRKFMDLFEASRLMSFSEFFKDYSEIADYCEDVLEPYEVIASD